MARLFLLLFIAQIVLAAIALISCLSLEKREIRALPRPAWVLIILLLPLVGAIAWFLAGRPARAISPPAWQSGSGFREYEQPRSLAPDDDPDFLHSLATNQSKLVADQSQQDQELLKRWEEDLRRREAELRRREADSSPRDENRPEA
jgi:hypothetical protein